MSLGQGIWEYFRACPLMDGEGRLDYGFLGAEPTAYTVDDEGPENPVLRRYLDGGSLRAKTFVLAGRRQYGPDARANISASGFFERLAEWVRRQNRLGRLPAMEGGKRALALEALTDGYLFATDENTARYQIQLRLTYYQEGDR